MDNPAYIKKRLQRRDIRLSSLAAATGVSVSWFKRFRDGHITDPGFYLSNRLAQYLRQHPRID